jgi:LuxR family transcriptional regulator, maltose regulon positive regulatory protein
MEHVAGAHHKGCQLAVSSAAPSIVERLTIREQEVRARIVDGRSNHEISEEFVVSIGTVKWHINQLYKTLGVRSRTHALAAAKKYGLL